MDFRQQPHYVEVPIRLRWRTKRQPFYFCMAAWWSLCESKGYDFEQIAKMNVNELNTFMLYEAAKQGSVANGKPFRMTVKQLLRACDNMKASDDERLKQVFLASLQLLEKVGKSTAGGEKKK